MIRDAINPGNRKAQMEMGETIVIIIVVIILLVLGITFYQKIDMRSISEQKMEISDLETIDLLNTIFSMPEFQCSMFGGTDPTCVDEIKLKAFTEVVATGSAHHGYYKQTFVGSDIRLKVIYPGDEEIIDVYLSGEPDNMIIKRTYLIPSSYCNPVTRTCRFAMLEITRYN